MSIHVALSHITRYRYDRLINLGPQVVRLRPAPHCRTRILSYSMNVLPKTHFINWQQDPQSNYLGRLVFPERTQILEIAVDLVAEMSVLNPFDFFLEEGSEFFPFRYDKSLDQELAPYLVPCHTGPAFNNYMAEINLSRVKTIDFLVGLNQDLASRINYLIRLEPGVQTPDETLNNGSGSCRDTAWLMVQVLRRLGLAARFASGYLIQLKSDIKAIDGPSGPEKDFTDLHAWCEVYLPGAGWIGLDPTSGLLAGEGHIPLACSPEPSSAAPISGTLDSCEVTFEHEMSVERVYESPRTSKPYNDEQWKGIEALGFEVDKALEALDVRLTMGGEPTFVANTDRGAAEWNFEALGPTKRNYGIKMLNKLSQHYGQGGFYHFGQGKWYPGEELPRWALSLYWLKNGEAVWKNPNLLCHEQTGGKTSNVTAKQFMENLCKLLGIATNHVVAGFEDNLYQMWRERKGPKNILPQSMADEVGYCLPIRAEHGQWHTGCWFFLDERMYLVPGDSPMGYRLPLDSQPWINPSATEPPSQIVRTALCIQVRNGHLYVFMPPLEELDDYLALLAKIEATAASMNQAVVIEGYTPPRDIRLAMLQVTPDPGVLEINVQPIKNWGELLHLSTTLYEEARLIGLSSEKFMLDGRHSGTGGGNHFVMGGETPDDSPFLRRPDLLGSLLRYWHNHPGLSYLFSGLFIGPTSQAPRVDEARTDQVHELELALHALDRQMEKHEGQPPPWIIDRLLRNILIDATGNTHRSEFCIDKLYSPDTATGRLGLLELRAFEMPPNAQMSLTQQLLLRALVAMFWKKPYTARLVKWGTRLHDQFMLSTFVKNDIADVVSDLQAAGFAFHLDWFNPHFAFRFPKMGEFNSRGVEIEIFSALEPWHVLGEEGAPGGTVRYVDSSLERVEVKVKNFVDERYTLTCNGVKIPLHSTGTEGEFVAGVRYRAWQPPNALHPTIGVHAPLVFDLIDTWNGRSLGGCQYHVAHPGGRNYDLFPVNAFEAESRRLSRFFRMGHTQGKIEVKNHQEKPEFPITLDLRWSL